MSYKVSEMESAFIESGESRSVASALLDELSHRSSFKAKALQKRLKEFQSKQQSEPLLVPISPSPPVSTPSGYPDISQKPMSGLSKAGFGVNFPVRDYYKEYIVDARTIQNNGKWWTAILVIADPKTGKRFIKMYKWGRKGGVWKTHSSIVLNGSKLVVGVIEAFSELKSQLD